VLVSNLDYSVHFIKCSYVPNVSSIPINRLRLTVTTERSNGAVASTRYRLDSNPIGDDPYKYYLRHADTVVGEINLGYGTDR
jgi:hypothetical protein